MTGHPGRYDTAPGAQIGTPFLGTQAPMPPGSPSEKGYITGTLGKRTRGGLALRGSRPAVTKQEAEPCWLSCPGAHSAGLPRAIRSLTERWDPPAQGSPDTPDQSKHTRD